MRHFAAERGSARHAVDTDWARGFIDSHSGRACPALALARMAGRMAAPCRAGRKLLQAAALWLAGTTGITDNGLRETTSGSSNHDGPMIAKVPRSQCAPHGLRATESHIGDNTWPGARSRVTQGWLATKFPGAWRTLDPASRGG